MENLWLFALFLALSGFIYLQFLRGRRRNLERIRRCSAILEKIFQPADKTYTWIGGVAGFKAEYRLRDTRKLYATFALLPRQSLLYFPISKLIFRADRLYLAFELPHLNKFKEFDAETWRLEGAGLKSIRKLEIDSSGRRLKALIWYEDDGIEGVLLWLKNFISEAI
ncbi:MAG: hypothetical protein J7K11_06335 [Candidatus Hydrothermae bacterium]|nr:hypothetical protein [Candidatus Hydrothermae bacterium]